MTRRKHLRSSDDGVMLIIALAIITVVALVSATLLSLGGTKFIATASLRQVASTGYAADAAAKVAIGDLELGSSAPGFGGLPSTATTPWVFDNTTDGTGCFGGKDGPTGAVPTTSINLSNFYTDSQSKVTKNATVTCSVVPGTGIFGLGAGAGGTGSTGGTSGTGRAVTLLGTAGGAFAAKNTNYMIHGDIVSAGPVTGTQITTGKVYATTCLPGSGQAGTQCPYTGTVDDPYAAVDPSITAVPTTLGTWSGCTFQPGYYDDATALSSATNACSVATFVPGNYYFDFHNNTADPTYDANSGIPSGSDVWNITSTVVGGQSVAGVTQPPGMCKSPINDTSAQGVQFIFGGDSTMSIGHSGNNYGFVELCGTYNNGKAPIVIYGLDGSSASRGSVASGYATTSSPTSTAGTAASSDFVPSSGTLPDALTATGDATADWPSSGGSTTSNNPKVVLSNFGGVTGVPAGSIFTSAKVVVTHKESTGTPSLKYTIGSSSGTPAGLTSQTSWSTQSVDLSSALSSALGPAFQTGGSAINSALSALNLTYSVATSGNSSKNAHLDAVKLVLTYYPPYWRGETNNAIPGNCVIALVNQCRMIELGTSGGSNKPALVVNGVTYVPSGAVGGNISNGAATIALRWGLVASSADFSGWPQYTFGFPLVSIPDLGPGLGSQVTAVDLKVYLCASGTCGTSGTPSLTVRVLITDPIDSTTKIVTPAPSTRQISILSWAEQR